MLFVALTAAQKMNESGIMSNKPNVYITGIAGFIGSTLAKKLHNEGYEVTGIDNLSGSDGSNLEGVDFTWEVGDIKNVREVSADTIVHLAAITNARNSNADEMLKVNFEYTTKLFNFNYDKKFIFASTCLVAIPYLNGYAESKLNSEVYFQEWSSNYTILRFSNVYGPNQRDWGEEPNVLAAWRKAALNNEPIRIDGDGTQVRDFIHVDDICEAIKLSIEKNCNEETFTICTGRQHTIRELADMVYPGAEIIFGYRHPLDYDYIAQSPEKAAKYLGFVAKERIEDYNGNR